MRYLGIDFGSKRIGLALSDEQGQFAFPLSVVEKNDQIVDQIINICAENKVSVVVVGESQNFQMADNDIMQEVRPFVEQLKKDSGLEVVLHPEFMTSQEAEKLQGKNDMLDASAASLILKSYLDRSSI